MNAKLVWCVSMLALVFPPSAAALTVGMVADDTTQAVTIFDADTGMVFGAVGLDGAGITVGDCVVHRTQPLGFVTDLNHRVWVVDLSRSPPALAAGTNPIGVTNSALDLALTADGKFLVACGVVPHEPISVVDIAARAEISTFPVPFHHCAAVETCSNGSVLIALPPEGVRRLTIDEAGTLHDTGQAGFVGPFTDNLACAPSSQSGIAVDSLSLESFRLPTVTPVNRVFFPDYYGLVAVFDPVLPRVYGRASRFVQAFPFHAPSGLVLPFPQFTISSPVTAEYAGIEQMALHPDASRLYLSEPGAVRVHLTADGSALMSITAPSIVSPTGVCVGPTAICGDAVVEPGEECDPPTSVAVCAQSSLAGAFAPCDADCTCPPRPLRHYQCYEVRPPQSFHRSGVALVDQFRNLIVDLTKASAICAPANKNDEDPGAVTDPAHLTNYQVHGARFGGVANQEIVTQFGTIHLDLVKPSRVLVPSSVGLPPGPAPAIDHFTCYKVRRARGMPTFRKMSGVRVETGFDAVTVDVVRPLRLCVPTNKNGEHPGAETHLGHLLCYRVRGETSFASTGVDVTNQFGQQRYVIAQRRELCVPALRNPPITTTSSTSTSTSTSTTSTTTTTIICNGAVCQQGWICGNRGSGLIGCCLPDGALMPGLCTSQGLRDCCVGTTGGVSCSFAENRCIQN